MDSVPEPRPDDRIATLERRVRWLMSTMTLLTLALIVSLIWQFFPHTGPVVAPGFVVVDGHGKRRAELGMRSDNTPMLRLDNPEERARAVMFLRNDGSAVLRLSDQAGVNRAELLVNDHGHPMFTMGGPDGHAIVQMGWSPDSSGGIRLSDAHQRRFWAAPSGAREP